MTAAYIALSIPSQPSSIPARNWRFNVVKQALRQRYQATQPNAGTVWGQLFPEPPLRPPSPAGRRAARAAVSLIAVAAGAAALLLRIAGRSPLTTIWAEDRTIFLVQALASPWHLFASYAGYLQLLPRLIAQLVAFLPLPEAAAAFAIAGAVIASAVALFVFYASAGHIHSAWLRAMLAAAVLLLPVAPLEIADSGVNTPWYVLFALFWAALWRPSTRRAMALAALIGLLAGASTTLALALAPLFLVRIAALRRPREHAVTAGYAVGLVLQVPVVLAAHNSRLDQKSSPHAVIEFLAHDVVLPALGWHLDWWLQEAVGRTDATVAVACVLAGVFGLIAVTQPARVRLLAALALGCGFLLAAAAAELSQWVTVESFHFHDEPGSRYTTLPIFLMQAAVIVAVDNVVRRARDRARPDQQAAAFGVTAWTGWTRARTATAAVAALALVLAFGWVTDFRSDNGRTGGTLWAPIASSWLATCQQHPDGVITVASKDPSVVAMPCANLRR